MSYRRLKSAGLRRRLTPPGCDYSGVTETAILFDLSAIEKVNGTPTRAVLRFNERAERWTSDGGDSHVLVVDRDNCVLMEVFEAAMQSPTSWTGGGGAIFNLNSNALRPDGWTSADAAGLPIIPGLVRYDEVEAGEIAHALRFTVERSQKAYLWPARHYASDNTSPNLPPMGARARLKATLDISGCSPEVRIIQMALQRYGMFVADNGTNWFISGAPDARWNNDNLQEIRRNVGNNLEFVDASMLMVHPNSGEVAVGAAAP